MSRAKCAAVTKNVIEEGSKYASSLEGGAVMSNQGTDKSLETGLGGTQANPMGCQHQPTSTWRWSPFEKATASSTRQRNKSLLRLAPDTLFGAEVGRVKKQRANEAARLVNFSWSSSRRKKRRSLCPVVLIPMGSTTTSVFRPSMASSFGG